MFPEPKKGASKVLYVFIAVLVLFLIVGGVSWFYFNSKSSSSETTATTTTSQPTTDTTTEAEPTIVNAPTDIATNVAQLDKELATIGLDELSNNDTIEL